MIKNIDKLILEDKKSKKLFSKEKYLKEHYKYISLSPYLIDKKKYTEIKEYSEKVYVLLEKTIGLFNKKPQVKEFFNLNLKQEKIFNIYDGERKAISLSRFDAFLDEKDDLKFMEFNINFPGGIERLDRIASLLMKYYDGKIKLKSCSKIKDTFLSMIKDKYRKVKNQKCVVFVYGSQFAKKSFGSSEEIARLVRNRLNTKVFIVHWKDIKIHKDGLRYKSHNIGLIFRMTLARRMWQYDYKFVLPILKHAKSCNIEIFNLPQAYLVGRKDLFALWYESWFRKMLTTDEIEVIKKTIPETYLLSNSLLRKVDIIKDKNKWVVKPSSGYGGKGVYIGASMNVKEWKKVINKHFGDNKWIIQSRIITKSEDIVILDTEKEIIKKEKTYFNISPWVINGKFAGVSARYSKDLVINVAKGGGIMTSFIADNT